MEKQEFLDHLLRGREQWEALLAQVGQQRMQAPDLPGGWSVKDVIGHVMWGEREMVGVMRQRALVGSELWNLTTDERNAIVVVENRSHSLEDILATEQQIFAEFLALSQQLTQQELNDASCFKEMPGDWLPWQVLAGNSFQHYQDHTPAIKAMLAGK